MLDPDDDIVIHCSNPSCIASIIGYQILTSMGYKKVRRYAGGISDWEDAGYPLEGSLRLVAFHVSYLFHDDF
jgi:rhodanese-related sulfurtransferase